MPSEPPSTTWNAYSTSSFAAFEDHIHLDELPSVNVLLPHGSPTDMPPLANERKAMRDASSKKTKSRNGCGRCKLKRLKCDETSPSCLQCKKRNVACPGYEKILKWSTKYEVLQPSIQFGLSPPEPGDTTRRGPTVTEIVLPPDVVSGFEALAAVLPARKKKPEPAPEQEQEPELEDDAEQTPPPPVNGVDYSLINEWSAEEDSTPEYESIPLPDFDAIDPMLLEGCWGGNEFFDEDLSFESWDAFDFLDPGPLDEIELDVEEVLPYPEDSISSTVTSPRLSRSLLLDYYRLTSSCQSPTTSSLDDMDSLLIQHYFKDVCVLFSSFDSLLNPFRTTIGRIYQDSPSIYYAIQSMAAAHLANTFPNMAAVGIEMQRKACECLEEELPLVQSGQASGTRTFLGIILLGLSTCWHESNALGEEYLTTARSLILPKLLSNSEEEEVQRETQFFEEALIYWEMLMGFVKQDAMTFSPLSGLRNRAATPKRTPAARKPDGKIVPHPWTGIAPAVQILFAEVGRLVRRERMLDSNGAMDLRRRQDNLLNAATLEEDLLAAEYPTAEELADPGDSRTAKHDFIVIAEAYRCAGLLELYRVFPCILRKRLGAANLPSTSVAPSTITFPFPAPRFSTPYEPTDTTLWLNSLALHILSALEALPPSSGTICVQPILLVVAACELKFVSSLDYFDVYANDAKIQQARQFATARLHECALRLPAKPLRKMIELVGETWRRMDAGGEAFWIDVMVEKGWYTVMG
ncbi:fungal-specific transcription factor domain-containing protein [Massariosphaeria phaeospora]|uniref:Fungal-specific transcription factor domain-containing protein n=1 Tax=Massariosphaeria phaeospora TaxID=100035 RepID=A0A7C8M4G9_9PLEO|nr:fungal-specific transcription factor domain-containing protein [Massariosphaeria phaeospora]